MPLKLFVGRLHDRVLIVTFKPGFLILILIFFRKNSNSSANSNDPDALSDDPNYKESVDFNERLGLEKSKTQTKAGRKFMQPSLI